MNQFVGFVGLTSRWFACTSGNALPYISPVWHLHFYSMSVAGYSLAPFHWNAMVRVPDMRACRQALPHSSFFL